MGQVIDLSTRVMEFSTRGLSPELEEQAWNQAVHEAFLRGLEPEEEPYSEREFGDGWVVRFRLHPISSPTAQASTEGAASCVAH